MIACHASTEDAEEEIQDEFDEQLVEEIRTTHQQEVLMVVGNLNKIRDKIALLPCVHIVVTIKHWNV